MKLCFHFTDLCFTWDWVCFWNVEYNYYTQLSVLKRRKSFLTLPKMQNHPTAPNFQNVWMRNKSSYLFLMPTAHVTRWCLVHVSSIYYRVSTSLPVEQYYLMAAVLPSLVVGEALPMAYLELLGRLQDGEVGAVEPWELELQESTAKNFDQIVHSHMSKSKLFCTNQTPRQWVPLFSHWGTWMHSQIWNVVRKLLLYQPMEILEQPFQPLSAAWWGKMQPSWPQMLEPSASVSGPGERKSSTSSGGQALKTTWISFDSFYWDMFCHVCSKFEWDNSELPIFPIFL